MTTPPARTKIARFEKGPRNAPSPFPASAAPGSCRRDLELAFRAHCAGDGFEVDEIKITGMIEERFPRRNALSSALTVGLPASQRAVSDVGDGLENRVGGFRIEQAIG